MASYLKQMAVTLLATVGAKDPSIQRHSERVTLLAVNIARDLALLPEDVEAIWLAGMVHDIGMVALPENVVHKEGSLSEQERRLVQSHVKIGADILRKSIFPNAITVIASQHHERMDGSGYPYGLKGGNISTGAKILAVADVFDTMTSVHPYRPALLLEEANHFLEQQKKVLFSPDAVRALPAALARIGLALRY